MPNLPDNAAIHQALIEAGYHVDTAELAAGLYGQSTHLAVEEYQRDHDLVEDGICGPKTWASLHNGGVDGRFTVSGWKYDSNKVPINARPVVQTAVREIGRPGTQENPPGSNRGERIDIYMHPDEGKAWCAGFVWWCFKHAEGGSPYPRLLSSLKVRDWAEKNSKLLSHDDPGRPGDVFIILRGDGHGHVGIIAHVLEPGRYATVEGNARDAVRGLVRTRGQFSAMARMIG